MWKKKLLNITKNLSHTAWGIPHSERGYKLSLVIAESEHKKINKDAIFAASYLHDIGCFEPYAKEGIDHVKRSYQVAGNILVSIGFPVEQIPLVKEIIRTHMYYTLPSNTAEARIFRDADILDFMGSVGIARIVSIVGCSWTPNLNSCIKLIENFAIDLPGKLVTSYGKEIGSIRQAEMQAFLNSLEKEKLGLSLI